MIPSKQKGTAHAYKLYVTIMKTTSREQAMYDEEASKWILLRDMYQLYFSS